MIPRLAFVLTILLALVPMGCQSSTASSGASSGHERSITAPSGTSVRRAADAAVAACEKLGIAVQSVATTAEASAIDGRTSQNDPVHIAIARAAAGSADVTITVRGATDDSLARRLLAEMNTAR